MVQAKRKCTLEQETRACIFSEILQHPQHQDIVRQAAADAFVFKNLSCLETELGSVDKVGAKVQIVPGPALDVAASLVPEGFTPIAMVSTPSTNLDLKPGEDLMLRTTASFPLQSKRVKLALSRFVKRGQVSLTTCLFLPNLLLFRDADMQVLEWCDVRYINAVVLADMSASTSLSTEAQQDVIFSKLACSFHAALRHRGAHGNLDTVVLDDLACHTKAQRQQFVFAARNLCLVFARRFRRIIFTTQNDELRGELTHALQNTAFLFANH